MHSETHSCFLATTPIKDVMSTHVETLMVDDKISDALSMMLDAGLTTAPVINVHSKCVGILSRSDLTNMLLKEDGELANLLDSSLTFGRFCESLETCDSRSVSEMMTYEVKTINQQQSAADACRLMTDQKIHHLPVVDDDGKVVGIISTFDVVRAVAEAE